MVKGGGELNVVMKGVRRRVGKGESESRKDDVVCVQRVCESGRSAIVV